jgi:hypothetical protein
MVRTTVNSLIALIFIVAGTGCSKLHKEQSDAKGKIETEEKVVTIDFTKYAVGSLPEGFSTAVTNGPDGKWKIVEAGGEKILAQTNTDDTDRRFPLCVYDKENCKDVEVSVEFKAVSGKVDQAAGLMARYKDKDNYYITRANALENNVRLYKVEGGNRKQIASADVEVTSGKWHNLKLEIEGTHQKVFFNGKQIIETDDATFSDAGKVGLWTKADSVTYFKNLKIEIE